MDFFSSAFSYLLKNEGGYSNDPDDKGGKTKFGITEAEFIRCREDNLIHCDSIHELTIQDARTIAIIKYWPTWNKLTSEIVAVKCFDAGFNMGVGTAIKLCRRALNGLYPLDQPYDPKSYIWNVDLENKINESDPDSFLKFYVSVAIDRYWSIVNYDISHNFSTYGWTDNDVNEFISLYNNRDEDMAQLFKTNLKKRGLKCGNLSFLKGWMARARRLPSPTIG
jgi:hypothetical protein